MTTPSPKSNPNPLTLSRDRNKNKSPMAYNEDTTMRVISDSPSSSSGTSSQNPIHQKTPPFFQTPPRITIPTSTGSGNHTPGKHNPVSPLPGFFVYHENIIQEGLQTCKRSILGKIISDKIIPVSALNSGLTNIWGAPAGLQTQEIEGNLIQFFMDKKSDQDRILLGNPWVFRNCWLVVKAWDRNEDPKSINFDQVPVWVQLWGLPIHCKTKLMGESLGALMGKVDLAELYEYPGKNIIVKIKVIIDVKNPLTTGIHIGNPVDGTNWIDYRYENLPLFASSVG